MEFDLIIDGNYILSKNVFVLNKHKVLYGELFKSMKTSLDKYISFGKYNKIYFVADSKQKSWRKNIHNVYKSTRKKDTDIDWNFVYETYDEFKNYISLEEKAILLEAPGIEGDDWIHILTKKANQAGKSTIIISGDGDLKQLLNYSIKDGWFNIILDDYVGRERMFVPEPFEILKQNITEETTDIFDLKTNFDLNSLTNKFSVIPTDNKKELFIKLIIGDKSDNISSVYETKSDKRSIGIGLSTCEKIYEKYIEDNDINENISEPLNTSEIIRLVKEARKLTNDNLKADDEISMVLERNIKLIHLHHTHLPKEIKKEIVNVLTNL